MSSDDVAGAMELGAAPDAGLLNRISAVLEDLSRLGLLQRTE